MSEHNQLQLDHEDFVTRMAIEQQLRSPDTSLDKLYELQAEARAMPPAVAMPREFLWTLLNQLPEPPSYADRFRDIYQRAGRPIPTA